MKLHELVDIKIGLTLERKKAGVISANTISYSALTLKSFTNHNNIKVRSYEEFIANSEIGAQYFTKVNDVVMRLRTPTNAIFISHDNMRLLVSSLMAIITNIFPNILESKYLAYYLNSQDVTRQLAKNTQGSAIPMIKIADLLSLDITLPPIEKQQQMIRYLDSSNDEIELLHQLTNHKRELHTKIFEQFISTQ